MIKLMESEHQAVIHKKEQQPHLSHRKISGYLQQEEHFISPSSCYRILKSLGWVLPQNLREAPWKVPHYEPFRPNQIWGEDWTCLEISGVRHYLLTIIDYFSRYIVAWGIVKTVSQSEVKNLVALAFLSEKIEDQSPKPLIRMDQGSANMAYGTKRLIRDLELLLSPSRIRRPTDNARQERWYRTVKQEEIYCYPAYPSLEIARYSLSSYIEEYNEKRPHQSLFNFTPGHVHRIGNKTILKELYRQKVQIVKEQRLKYHREALKLQKLGAYN
jgi:transposase-like protein